MENKEFKECLDYFQIRMRKKLEKHSNKGGWKNSTLSNLYNGMMRETEELARALYYEKKDFEHIIDECADVANMAMMIADNVKTMQDMFQKTNGDDTK